MQNPFRQLKHAWNAFRNKDPTIYPYQDLGFGYGYRPDRIMIRSGNERSIVSALYNRIANDVASNSIRHVRLDQNGRYESTIDSSLNQRLTVQANKDQTARDFIRDAAYSLCDEGSIAIVPVDADMDPTESGSFQIDSLRIGKILEWYPDHVRVSLYDDRVGDRKDIIVPKKTTAIIENPFYMVMNEPNSTLQRLINKLGILDVIDNQSGSGKLDLIIQLPYVVRTQVKREQAEQRRKDIEAQLSDSKYGIAYTDGTERITQLNRPVENNLMTQIEYLTKMVYNQLGMTEEIFQGTADEATVLNYYNTTIEPMLAAIIDGMKIKFLTKTARTQGQTIMFFRDPFKLVPADKLADIADKFTRNEILTSNEVRAIIGYKPSNDPGADELRNKNIAASKTEVPNESNNIEETNEEGEDQNGRDV